MRLKKDLLIIIILLFVSSLAWIGASVHTVINSSTISEDFKQDISPIDPKIDTATIDKLKSREEINPTFGLDGSICLTCNSTSRASSPATPAASQAGTISP